MIEVRDSMFRKAAAHKGRTAKQVARQKADRCLQERQKTLNGLTYIRVRESGRYFVVEYSNFDSETYIVVDSFRF